MQFILIAHDKASGLALWLATCPAHLEFCQKEIGYKLPYAGPMLGEDGSSKGSVMVVETVDEAEAKELFATDRYALAGLFAQSSLTGFKTVFRDGMLVQA